jgi:glycosyltransferase involved in cell wall biosynthesis
MTLTALAAKMSEQRPEVEFVVLENRHFPLIELNGLPNVTRVVCPGAGIGRSGRVLYQNSVLPLFLRTQGLNALLATCNVLPLGCPVPSVVVVQSLQYFDYPEAYGWLRRTYLRAALEHACRHAKFLICVSESARRDLLRLVKVQNKKVHVVHHGISPAIVPQARTSRSDSPPYILSIATLYRFKNLARLIKAFADLKNVERIPHRLRIIGAEADVTAAELASLAMQLGVLDQVDFIGPVPHSRIASEYAQAAIFVYPSLYETFGYPPLEAMAMSVPVVAARASSIPEIVGDAAELVDPLDVADIARGIKRVLLDSERAQALIRLGLKRSSEFTWETSARQTFALLESASL